MTTPETNAAAGDAPRGRPMLFALGLLVLVAALATFRRDGADGPRTIGHNAAKDDTAPQAVPSPQATTREPEPKPSTLLGLRIHSAEEAEAERRAIRAKEDADRETHRRRIEEDFSAWMPGARFAGDAVNAQSGARTRVVATVVGKQGSVESQDAEVLVKIESADAEHVVSLIGTYPGYVGSRGSKRRYLSNLQQNLTPKLRFARVAAEGVPLRRHGPALFVGGALAIEVDDQGALTGRAGDRYRRDRGVTFTLRPIDPRPEFDLAKLWRETLKPGVVLRGSYEQSKRMGYNESPFTVRVKAVVAEGESNEDRYLLLQREGAGPADLAVVLLTQGPARLVGGWHYTGAREAPTLDSLPGKDGILFSGGPIRGGVPVAARLTDRGRLAMRVGPNGSAELEVAGATPTPLGIATLPELLGRRLAPGTRLRGEYRIPAKHHPGPGKPVVTKMPARLAVTESGPEGWRMVLTTSGEYRFTAEFRGEIALDPSQRAHYPLRLRRVDLKRGGTSEARGVCLLCQNEAESPEVLFRLTHDGQGPVLIGATPKPNSETLVFRFAGDTLAAREARR